MNERLHRSFDDRMVAGVCAGIADYFGMDPSVVRVLYALVAIASGIVPLLIVYVVLAMVLPEGPTWAGRNSPVDRPWSATGGPPPDPMAPGTGWRGDPQGGRPAAAAGVQPPGSPDGPPGPWGTRRAARAGPGGEVALLIGACLVLAGLALLVEPYLHIPWDLVWPIAVIAIGALLVVGGFGRRG